MSIGATETLLLSGLVLVAGVVYGMVLRSRRPMTEQEIERAKQNLYEKAKKVRTKNVPPRHR